MESCFVFFIFGAVFLLARADQDFDTPTSFIFKNSASVPSATTIAPNGTLTVIRTREGQRPGSVRNSTANLKSRALFDLPDLGGGATSIETNFLSIQSGNTKLNQQKNFNGAVYPPYPGTYKPDPPIPVGAENLYDGNVAGRLPYNPNLSPIQAANCRCEAYADCRDISAFARSDKPRADFCPPGQVLCCAKGKPIIAPPQPQPILIPGSQSYPGPSSPLAPLPQPVSGPIINGGVAPTIGCGVKGGNPLARTFDITNMKGEAEFGEYPWMTAILKTDLSYVCGGALIDARVVLTAAHCVAKVKNENLIVRLGEYDVSETSEPPYQDMHVKKVIIHADYHSGTLRNDIALLLLDQPVQMNNYIRPVCLPPVRDYTGMSCQVSGWGKNNPNGQFSNILKEVEVPIIDSNQCQNLFRTAPELGPVFNLHDSFVCAGLPGKDACAGDGGSPLVCKVDGAYRLVGLVSWGINCGQYPGAYTKVSNFLPWILNVLQINQ